MKLVIGGQIDKDEIAKLVDELGKGQIEYRVMSDLDAAMALQSGVVDYYIGACNTGGGGALALAMALVGADQCVTLSMPGKIMPEEQIREQLQSGKKAFGFTAQDKDVIVPIIVEEFLKLR